jgi:hypothetical protein
MVAAVSVTAGAIVAIAIVLLVVLSLNTSFSITAVNVSYTGSGSGGICSFGPTFPPTCEPNGYDVCLVEALGPCPNHLAAGQSGQAAFDAELQNTSECSSVYEITQVTTTSTIFQITNVTSLGLGLPFLLGHTPVPNDPMFCTTGLQVIVDYTVHHGTPTAAPLDLLVTVVLE